MHVLSEQLRASCYTDQVACRRASSSANASVECGRNGVIDVLFGLNAAAFTIAVFQ